jgi:hypothetical protein
VKAPHRLVIGVVSAVALSTSLAISVGAPAVRGLGPLPSTGLPLPTVSLPLPTLPLPTVSLPLPTVSLPLPTLPLPTVSLPLPTVSLPLPTVSLPVPTLSPTPSPPLPTLTAPPGSGTPQPTDGSQEAASTGANASPDGGASDNGSGGSGPDIPGDATQAGLQVPEAAVVAPSLPNVGTWLVPGLGVAVPALLVVVLVIVQVFGGAAGIRATRGMLDRVGMHVPPWLRRADATGERTGPG